MAINDVILAQAEELIVNAVTARSPELDLRPGTPQYDIYVRPYLTLVAEIVEQNNLAERKRTPVNPEDLTDEEAEAHAAKFFVTRNTGTKSVGTVRVKLKEPADIAMTTANVVSQDGELNYSPTADFKLAAGVLSRDPVLGYYYFDFNVIAENSGDEYDAPIGSTFTVDLFDGDPNFIEAIASSPIQGGQGDESNADLLERTRKGQTVRNLINPTSTEFVLKEKFKGVIDRMLVIGYQEPEMRRDLKAIVDQVLGPITIHLGNHTDIYVKTPIIRTSIEFEVPEDARIDLADFRALLKIHSVSVKGDEGVPIFFELVDQDPKTRYSAEDTVKLFVDPALAGLRVVVDLSYAPDVVAVNDFINSPEERVSLANILVRYFHPVWLNGNIYVDGAISRENDARRTVDRYLAGLTGSDPLVVSRITDALHDAGVGLVHQDFDITAEIYYGDGEFLEMTSDTILEVPNRYEKGFSQRVAVFINEGIEITALS